MQNLGEQNQSFPITFMFWPKDSFAWHLIPPQKDHSLWNSSHVKGQGNINPFLPPTFFFPSFFLLSLSFLLCTYLLNHMSLLNLYLAICHNKQISETRWKKTSLLSIRYNTLHEESVLHLLICIHWNFLWFPQKKSKFPVVSTHASIAYAEVQMWT